MVKIYLVALGILIISFGISLAIISTARLIGVLIGVL